jgi:hypothetical protein
LRRIDFASTVPVTRTIANFSCASTTSAVPVCSSAEPRLAPVSGSISASPRLKT